MKKNKIMYLFLLLFMFIYVPKVSAMRIYVKKPNAENLNLEVESSDTIEAIKERIYHIDNNFLPENQRLIFRGKEMENGRTLADYEVQMDSTVHLMFKINSTFKVKYNIVNLNVTTENVTIDGNIGNNTYVVSKTEKFKATLEALGGYKLPNSISVKVNENILETEKYMYDSQTGMITIDKENINGDILIEASAVELDYKVTFNANGGLFKDNKEILIIDKWENNMETTLEKPIRDGYKFKGYYTEKTGGTKFEMILNESGIDSNMIFYAQWEENSAASEAIENPNTGDNIKISIILLILSSVGLFVTFNIINKKKHEV